MYEQLEKLDLRYQELEQLLGSQEQITERALYNKLAKELSDIKLVVSCYREYKNVLKEIADLEVVMLGKHEQDFLELVRTEQKTLVERMHFYISHYSC